MRQSLHSNLENRFKWIVVVVLEVNDVRLQVGAARVAVGKVRQLPAVAVESLTIGKV